MFEVLIVEDDPLLAHQLLAQFQTLYQTRLAKTYAECEAWLEHIRFDLILLDRILPDGDTLELLPYIRDCSPATRVLLMSCKSAALDRIAGLEEGADDYVPKPIDQRELLLRAKRLLQLDRVPVDDWQEVGRLRFNQATGETYASDGPVHLRPKEAQILAVLLKFKNRVVTRETIINHVWGATDVPTDTTLDVYLRRLRMLLGPQVASYIQTVRGYGYLIKDEAGSYK